MTPQPSPEAVALVAAACRTQAVFAVAAWQGIDFTSEQAAADAAEEALFQFISSREQALADVYRCGKCLAISVIPERCPECGEHRP